MAPTYGLTVGDLQGDSGATILLCYMPQQVISSGSKLVANGAFVADSRITHQASIHIQGCVACKGSENCSNFGRGNGLCGVLVEPGKMTTYIPFHKRTAAKDTIKSKCSAANNIIYSDGVIHDDLLCWVGQ